MRNDIALGFALVMAACAGRHAGPSESFGRSSDLGTDAVSPDAGDAAVRSVASLKPSDLHFDAGVSDPSRLLADASERQVFAQESAGRPGASGLVLRIAESGPDKPWTVVVSNQGSEPAVLTADTRLLWFEVNVPGSKNATQCRLPADLLPKDVEPRLTVKLLSGESVAQSIDPRLYCFASGDQKQLVPGARVVTHFGWPELPNKTSWENGKKVSSPVPEPPPYVAHLANVDVEAAVAARTTALKVVKSARLSKGRERPSDAALGVPLPIGVDKQLLGPELTLRDTYAEWSTKHRSPTDAAAESPLELRLVQGSDARTDHDATVQMTLHNRSKRPLLVYFRREFVTFEVVGPAGVQTCNPAPDARSPDREAFVTLGPGASRSFSSRLAEMCPHDTFDMPGLYLVSGEYDATESGAQWNLAAFTGSVRSHRPVNVRIRVGELSILQKVILRRPDDGQREAAVSVPPVGDAGATTPVVPGRRENARRREPLRRLKRGSYK
jgi:hypothetical protein